MRKKNALFIYSAAIHAAGYTRDEVAIHRAASHAEGYKQLTANAKAVKSFRNGMLVIEKNGEYEKEFFHDPTSGLSKRLFT